MKYCPQCGTSYTDETLRFCLADGTALTGGEEPTLVYGRREQTKVDIPQPTAPAFSPPTQPTIKKSSSGTVVKVVIALVVVAVLGLIAIGGAGVLYFMSTANQVTPVPQKPSPPATPPKSSTTEDEKAKLEKEVADLKRKLEEQAPATSGTEDFPTDPDYTLKTATVNSPGDGFLALRNLPSSDIGERIGKIPHGDTVEVLACSPTDETIGARTGKWCLVSWQNQAGWVFDAWLDYEKKF